ncbi:MAG: hypothetical protein ACRDCE_08830 [Cetobacterium sp.]|uniref:hypothetical protein n=1 Tax=Cetobacterium sp. TaxID=2071632 RepID=UPI003EE7F054
MANFFEGVKEALLHPVKEIGWMWDTTKDVISGDMDLKDIPGSHQDLMNKSTVPILGNNKLAKNSDAAAGAVVGGFLAAPFIGGAMGGGSMGGGAPVVEAVGQTPLEAVLAGGGNASEVGSISPDLSKRLGGVLNQFGSQLTQQSAASTPQAPAFKPKFTPNPVPQFGQDVMAQLGAADYNIKF